MENTSILLGKFAHELPSTSVGVISISLILIYNDYADSIDLLSITWGERILVFIIAGYVAGKIFSYLGFLILEIIANIIHIWDFNKNINIFIDHFRILKPSTKSVSIFPDKLITQPLIMKYIGSEEYLSSYFSEKNISLTFCLSLLGAVVITPYFIDVALYSRTDYRLLTLFCLMLAISSKIQRNRFYGHCAKEVSNTKQQG